MKNICIIPARGGSKRIPRKNIKTFMGKPIIAYSIEAALQSGLFDEVMVSTDDEEIAEIACGYGAKVPFMRSAETSNDYAGTADVILEVLEMYKERGRVFDTVCCIRYPIQRSLHIVDGRIGMVYPEYMNARSQDLEPIYHDAGQFYFSRINSFVESRTFWGKNTAGLVLSELEVQDLDTLTDWTLAEMKYELLHR